MLNRRLDTIHKEIISFSSLLVSIYIQLKLTSRLYLSVCGSHSPFVSGRLALLHSEDFLIPPIWSESKAIVSIYSAYTLSIQSISTALSILSGLFKCVWLNGFLFSKGFYSLPKNTRVFQ